MLCCMKINENFAASTGVGRMVEKYLALGLINKRRDFNALGRTEPEINLAHITYILCNEGY